LIAGAGNNSVTVLCRNGEVVATTSHMWALLPRGHSRNELYSQHRGWVHFRLVKEGDTIRVFVWDNEVLTYIDPEPLDGGYAGVWSVANGLLLGKVRLAATKLGPADPFPFLRDYAAFTDPVLSNEGDEARVRIVCEGDAYAITNCMGGGPFAVALQPRVFSALEHPKLSFDMKLPPEAKVDLYLTCHDRLYRVRLSGPKDDSTTAARRLGEFEGVEADGEWHHVSFDLLGALRRLHPDDSLLMVWQPAFANYANEHYLLAGFGGNRVGTTYWLRNVRLSSAEEGTTVAAGSMSY
jgi:hypothetical protein